jgi:hypothetical protein
MKAKKTVLGLSLLCALVFSAFGAASAQAVNHTTAFTCDPNASVKDFTDAHCDTKGVGGSFGHTAIAANTSTEIIGTNTQTSDPPPTWIFKLKIAATTVEIHCGKVGFMGVIENNTTSEDIKGSGVFDLSECTLFKPEAQKEKCTVAIEGKELTFTSEGHGLRFSPVSGVIAKMTLANKGAEKCALAGTYNMEGTIFAHGQEGTEWSGATWHFTAAETEKTLSFAGNPASLEGTLTFRMGPTATPGNPIVATTLP